MLRRLKGPKSSLMWDSILEIVERESPPTLAPIVDALHSWVYPETLAFGQGPDEATAETIRAVATRVLSRLAHLLYDKPGMLHRLREYASGANLAVSVSIHPEFDVLFPADWDGSDEDGGYEAWARRAEEKIRQLAAEFEELPEGEVAARIAVAETEASSAGITYPRFTPQLAQVLATRAHRPDLFIEALEQRAAPGDVLLPFLDRVVAVRPDGWEATVERLLDVDMYRWTTMRVALVRPVGARLKDAAIERMTAQYAQMIDGAVVRDELNVDTVVRLLDAPDALVARTTAVALAIRPGGAVLSSLPDAARRRWREVIVQNQPDEYWYSQILGREPEMFADWLRAWFVRMQQAPLDNGFLPDALENAIERLPVSVRIQLIRAVPSDVNALWVQEVVARLVSTDLDVAAALFERTDLGELHGAALQDGPSEGWMDRALVALERGWEPPRIVASTVFSERGWSGEESQHWQRKIEAFASLRQDVNTSDSRRESIIAAGIEYFEQMRDRAAERERRERIFGR